MLTYAVKMPFLALCGCGFHCFRSQPPLPKGKMMSEQKKKNKEGSDRALDLNVTDTFTSTEQSLVG